MPDYSKLPNMVSHRVSFDYDTGARIVGYLAGCKPATGPVQCVLLSRVDIIDQNGAVIEHHDELSLVPNLLVSFRITEGPGGF